MVGDFFGKRVREPGDAPVAHMDRKIGPFDVTGRDVRRVGAPLNATLFDLDALAGAIAPHSADWLRVALHPAWRNRYQHRSCPQPPPGKDRGRRWSVEPGSRGAKPGHK